MGTEMEIKWVWGRQRRLRKGNAGHWAQPRYKSGSPGALPGLPQPAVPEDLRGPPTPGEVGVTSAGGQHSPGVEAALPVDATPDTKGGGSLGLSLLPSGSS